MRVSTRNLVLAGLFIALGLYLPFLTAQIPGLGSRLLPMHIPVLISGFVLGWPYGLAIGFVTPLFRSFLFGMPPMIPTALAMSFELAAYGAVTGLVYRLLPRRNLSIIIALVVAMLAGRLVWGTVSYVIFGLVGRSFTWQLFVAGGFVNAIPGMALQIITIPLLVAALERAGFMGRS